MADAAQGTPQEFWSPPPPLVGNELAASDLAPAMAEVCPRCSSEFLLGSRFCHTCGGTRPLAVSPDARADAAAVAHIWERSIHQIQTALRGIPWRKVKLPVWSKIQTPSWLHYLHFHEIKSWVGLPTASLIAFVLGIACVAGALLVGLLTAKTLVDWQAIQIYRLEWLVGATASFTAGILLKKNNHGDND